MTQTREDLMKDAPKGCLHIEMGEGFCARINGGPWIRPAGQYGRGGVLNKAARRLIAQGMDEATPVRATRNGTRIWVKDFPLSYWAGLSVSETDSHSVKTIRYTPMRAYWDEPISQDSQ